MNLKKIIVLFLLTGILTGVFCACRRYQEGNPDTGGTLTPAGETGTPMLTKEPVPTLVPEHKELLPIDEEHFASEVFRNYITEHYDCDGDGYLSNPEQSAITEICIDYSEDVFAAERLDGFKYFPALERLDISSAGEIVLQNHPGIKYFGGEEGHVGKVFIEDCPALTNIGFYHHGIDSLYISRVSPEARLVVTGCYLKELAIDADLTLGVGSEHGSGLLPISGEDFNGIGNIEFLSQNETAVPFSEEYWKDYFEHFDKNDFSYMEVQVLEKIEDCYDERGRKGWNVCINRKVDAYSKTVFSLYTENVLEKEQIFIRPAGVEELEMLEYSPNRGGSFHVIWELEAVYADVSGEIVLGTMKEDQYWTISADGTKVRYRSEGEWERRKNAKH